MTCSSQYLLPCNNKLESVSQSNLLGLLNYKLCLLSSSPLLRIISRSSIHYHDACNSVQTSSSVVNSDLCSSNRLPHYRPNSFYYSLSGKLSGIFCEAQLLLTSTMRNPKCVSESFILVARIKLLSLDG